MLGSGEYEGAWKRFDEAAFKVCSRREHVTRLLRRHIDSAQRIRV